jgi:hypothetical protein
MLYTQTGIGLSYIGGKMKEIPLSKGLVALVDDCDFEWLNQWEWYASSGRLNSYYARRSLKEHKSVLMHREIMGVVLGQFVDHRDHNTLNNCRYNLRYCDLFQNAHNASIRKDSGSGFKGVGWHKNRHKWQAHINTGGKIIYLGIYDTPEEGADAYDKAALQYFGEFALTNKQLRGGM